MNAASEAVLIAVDGLEANREIPTRARIAMEARPPLGVSEAEKILEGLIRDGHVAHADFVSYGPVSYRLTPNGRDYAFWLIRRDIGALLDNLPTTS